MASSGRVLETLVRKVEEARNFIPELLSVAEDHGRLGRGSPLPGAAIDSTYPPEGGVELVGGLLVGVVAGYVVYYGSARIKPMDVRVRVEIVEDEEARRRLPVKAKLLEKLVALRLVEHAARGALEAKVLLVDGELVPYQVLFGAGGAAVARLDSATLRLLEAARRHGITLVGVVKRSYSRFVSAAVGRLLPLNDKALMSLALEPGGYAVLGRFADLLPRYAALDSPQLRRAGARARRVLERRPEYGEVVVAFYKPWTGSQAVRVEVLDYGGLGVRAILEALASMTNPATGLPYPIDLVDEYVRFEARLLELVRRRLVAKLVEQLGPAAAVVLAHTNPEKRYVFEPRRLRRRL